MAGLVPAIHVFLDGKRKTWIPGTRPGMTLIEQSQRPTCTNARQRRTPKPSSLLRLAGILDGLEGREFDVVEFAVDLLDLADVDVLHDVAGFRIDRDRAARAFPLHALHRLDQRLASGLAAGLFQRLIDQVD